MFIFRLQNGETTHFFFSLSLSLINIWTIIWDFIRLILMNPQDSENP